MINDAGHPAALETLESELRHMQELFGPGVQSPPNCFLHMQAVYAHYESRGISTMLLTGEAFNGRGKLVASASANVVIMRG